MSEFITIFQYPFFLRALIIGVLLAVVLGLLGVFIVLRRMAFFTDAVAHASLAGIAIALLLKIPILLSSLIFTILVALGIGRLGKSSKLSMDAVIGVFFASTLALGVILISFLPTVRVDLPALLFGDILGVSAGDIVVISVLTVAVIGFFIFFSRGLARVSFHRDLSRVEGLNVSFYEYAFLAVLAVAVVLGLKIVGVILIGPMLILPAITARNLSGSLRGMVVWSFVIAFISVIGGLLLSFVLDLPSGPTIVIFNSILFGLSLLK